MRNKILLALAATLAALVVGIVLSFTTFKTTPLFDSVAGQWGILVASIAGLVLGAARGLLKKKNAIEGDVVTRHGVGSFISHWTTAVGIFAAIYSGVMLGFFIMNGKSLWVIPVFSQTLQQVIPQLNVHYFAVILTLFGSLFFVADYIATRDWSLLIPNLRDVIHGFIGKYFLRRKWDNEDKYLSSQKSAAIPYLLVGLVILITGAVKTLAHVEWLPGTGISASAWGWATVFHDVFTVLIVLYTIVHVGLVVLLGHWPSLISWFTGTMPKETVEHHHPVWYEKLTTGKNKS